MGGKKRKMAGKGMGRGSGRGGAGRERKGKEKKVKEGREEMYFLYPLCVLM